MIFEYFLAFEQVDRWLLNLIGDKATSTTHNASEGARAWSLGCYAHTRKGLALLEFEQQQPILIDTIAYPRCCPARGIAVRSD